jgi:FlaA1/EpsC-like NDP-sugar epimerase
MANFGILRPPYRSHRINALTSSAVRGCARILLDISLSGLSFLLAVTLRLGAAALDDGQALLINLFIFSGVCAVTFQITGLWLRSWRFVSVADIFIILRDIMIAIASFIVLSSLIASLRIFPLSVPLIAGIIMVNLLGGVRVLYRCHVEGSLPLGVKNLLRVEPVCLVAFGATAETEGFLRSLQLDSARPYQVVGIIDDDEANRDRRIRGVKVVGGAADLPLIVERFAASSIKLASLVLPASGLPRQKLRELVDAATRAGLRAVRLPRTCDLLQQANEPFAFEPIEVTDLLGREPIALRLDSIDALIRNKSVVVTGGGGSIGSELCRHLLRRGPAKLVIIDHSEFNLFNIQRELAAVDPDGVVQPILASVRDRKRIHAIFAEAQAELVFHAAAYKHVPMVELNPVEGIMTNVVGTSNVADAAAAVGAAAMIMVSTDKAVKPSCTMGLSKRIAEAYCQAIDLDGAKRSHRTRFMVVRFGNVLGSSGSVVPIFEQQIKRGGPVTVTDPAMTRYFMTIPEAVELVLQGSAFGFDRKSWLGAILVLDMGEPVHIVELAHRMISLAGFVPEKDIHIEFVGIRDGEKLHEELFDDDEILETTDIPGIRLARSQVRSLARMRDLRDQILRSAQSADAQSVVAMLREALEENPAEAFTGMAANLRASITTRGDVRGGRRRRHARPALLTEGGAEQAHANGEGPASAYRQILEPIETVALGASIVRPVLPISAVQA